MSLRHSYYAAVAALLIAPAAASADHHTRTPNWVPVPTGSDQQYRGLDAVSARIAWVGGSDGEVSRTTDGGRSWQDVSPPNTTGLLFRDVEAFSSRRASVLAIGPGEASRIYTTFDGGRHWKLAFVNDDPDAFYDCMDFYGGGPRGLAVSDPVGGKFRILATNDFGLSWHVLPTTGTEAQTGEAGFAASGTCLVTSGHDAWFGTGGVDPARVFHSRDGGFTWTATKAPIPGTPAGGVFSLAFRTPRDGVMVGGDFTAPDNGADASGFTRDGGQNWLAGGDLSGYRSGVDFVWGARDTLIAVGPNGSDVSYDSARHWTRFDAADYDAVDCVPLTCWASGPAGAVAVLR